MFKQLTSITKAIKEYSGTLINSSIVIATGAIEQVTTFVAYRCPCVSLAQLDSNCTEVTRSMYCSHLLNYSYGLSFILAPAIALFIAGIAGNPNLWKSLTGCCAKMNKPWCDICITIMFVAGKAVISPITWIVVALLDGKYLACAITPLPYDVERTSVQDEDIETFTCNHHLQSLLNSNAFNNNKVYSQCIGLVLAAVMTVAGFICYSIIQCRSPLTYYHAKFYKFYRLHEESEFDDEMNKKAQKDAEANVLKFMEERRAKKLWDQISTVCKFRRDKKELALYSNLHEWALRDEAEENDPCHDNPGLNLDLMTVRENNTTV